MNSSSFKEFEKDIVKLSNKINEFYKYSEEFINLKLEENKIYPLILYISRKVLYKKNLHFNNEELEIIFRTINEEKELNYSSIFISLCERIILNYIPKFVIEFEHKLIEESGDYLKTHNEINHIIKIVSNQLTKQLPDFFLEIIDKTLIESSINKKINEYLVKLNNRDKVNTTDRNVLIQNINTTIRTTFEVLPKTEITYDEYKEIIEEIFTKLNIKFLKYDLKERIGQSYEEIFKDKYIQYGMIYNLYISISMTYEYFKRIKFDDKIKKNSYKSLIIINIFNLLSNNEKNVQHICTRLINRKTFYKYKYLFRTNFNFLNFYLNKAEK
jgi:hypothetical protein